MDKLMLQYQEMNKALLTFKNAIELYKNAEKKLHDLQIQHPAENIVYLDLNFEEIIIGLKDSLIQRFEYSVDYFWKYLKNYIEIELKIVPDIKGPKHIIRACGQCGLISERNTELALEMIESRNLTSHMYKEEIATIVSGGAQKYYTMMITILEKAKPENV